MVDQPRKKEPKAVDGLSSSSGHALAGLNAIGPVDAETPKSVSTKNKGVESKKDSIDIASTMDKKKDAEIQNTEKLNQSVKNSLASLSQSETVVQKEKKLEKKKVKDGKKRSKSKKKQLNTIDVAAEVEKPQVVSSAQNLRAIKNEKSLSKKSPKESEPEK